MNVSQAALSAGLPAKTLRYYEEVGLVRPTRAANGYRDYCETDLARLSFLRRARNLGFSLEECRHLMALYDDRNRASHDVREIARAHLAAIDEKMADLARMRATLAHLVEACSGDERPECPILEEMAGEVAR